MNRIDVGFCTDLLKALPAGCANLVFADPPFNIGYRYDEYTDRMSEADYLMWSVEWVGACARLLDPTGAFFIAANDERIADYKIVLDACRLHFRNWIVWHYTFGTHQERKFGRDHTHILYYTADPDRFTFNADDIRVESQRQRDGDPRANPKGRVPGDVWSVPRLPGNAHERTGHPCQMPEAVLERIIRACSNPGDLVVDPFCGSGTTAAVAKRLGRRWYSCDVSAAYVAAANERLEAITGGAA